MLRLLHKTGTRPPEVAFSCRRMAARHCWAGSWTLSTIQSWTQCLPFNIVRCPLTDAPKRWYKNHHHGRPQPQKVSPFEGELSAHLWSLNATPGYGGLPPVYQIVMISFVTRMITMFWMMIVWLLIVLIMIIYFIVATDGSGKRNIFCRMFVRRSIMAAFRKVSSLRSSGLLYTPPQ